MSLDAIVTRPVRPSWPAPRLHVDTYSLSWDAAKEKARKLGQVIKVPGPYELFVDIDNEADFEVFKANVAVLHSLYPLTWEERPSKSGLPHRHIVVTFETQTVSEHERLLLEAVLGGDRMRALLGWVTIEQKMGPHGSVFFESKR